MAEIQKVAKRLDQFHSILGGPKTEKNTLLISLPLFSETQSSGSQESALKRGVNKVCVENKNWDGVAGFTLSTRGCEKFEITPNAIDSNAADVKIVLKPTHYQVAFKFFNAYITRCKFRQLQSKERGATEPVSTLLLS